MGIAGKYNKNNIFTFKTPKEFEYHSLEDLFKKNGAEHLYLLKAVFVNNKSRYGDAPVAVTNNCMVNLPSHMLATVNEMLEDDEFIASVNNDLVGFRIYSYYPKTINRLCYSVTWIDIERRTSNEQND